MYLKQIDILGFKSFGEKVRLDFDHGISAIVGPNGCGKSNFADAIKWVLGEQGTRSLRCAKMEDVLFNGSQSRPSTSLAEVTLTFDNSENVLPIDYSEVMITRRLFRSGESEYYINKTQCRLKDVRDLFLDTGIGAEAYSFIEQGKVEFILKAKPEERRGLFEEAAGVSKYKVRKEETIRRLEKVDLDMLRINDSLALYREQIRALDSAVRKTKQYKKTQEELKTWEIVSLVREFKSLETDVDHLQKQVDTFTQDLAKITTQIDTDESQLMNLRTQITEKEQELIQSQNRTQELGNELVRKEEKLKRALEKIEEINVRQPQLQSETNNEENELNIIRQELSKADKEIHDLSIANDSSKNELTEKENHHKGLQQKIKNIDTEIGSLRSRQFAAVQEMTKSHNEMTHFQSSIERATLQKNNLLKDTQEFVAEKETLTAQLNELTHNQIILNTEISDLNTQRQNSFSTLEQKRNDLLTVSDLSLQHYEQITQLKTTIELVSQWKNEKTAERSGVKAIIDAKLPGIYGPIFELIHVDKNYQKIVENWLEDRLFYFVSDTVECTESAIRYLKDNNLGRATFIVLEKLDSFNASSSTESLNGETKNIRDLVNCDNKFASVINFLFNNVLVKENTVVSNEILQGGSEPQTQDFISQIQKLEEAKNEFQKTEVLYQESSAKKSSLMMEVTANEMELNQITLNLKTKQMESNELNKKITELKSRVELLDKECEVIHTELDHIENEINRFISLKQNIDNKINEHENEEQNLKINLENKEMELLGLREEEQNISVKIVEYKVNHSANEEKYVAKKREQETLTRELNRVENILQQNKEEIINLNSLFADNNRIVDTEKSNMAQLDHDKQESEKLLSSIREKRNELQNQNNQLESNLRTLRHEYTKKQDESNQTNIRFDHAHTEKEHVFNRLRTDYSFKQEEEEKYISMIPPQEESETEITHETKILSEAVQSQKIHEQINKLKNKIESFGSVNLAAPEEYEQLEARVNFLTTQQEDLLKAKEDLIQLINKINVSTKEKFKSTFEEVRKNFREVFKMLFEGGEADLILTNEGDLLETGIEIYVQPVGKKLQNISLLSGGECAMTAIALLFAFFMVRPAPFCLLDEVDAALDPANVRRFTNLLKEFSKKSQFVIITHNNRTMEIANTYYGVTMEEYGISKFYALKYRNIAVPSTSKEEVINEVTDKIEETTTV